MIVTDTNEVAYLMLPSGHTALSEQLLDVDPDWNAPVLRRGEMRDVLSLVHRSSCSAYDCEFVALARRLDVPLVTMDGRVIDAFPETAVALDRFILGASAGAGIQRSAPP